MTRLPVGKLPPEPLADLMALLPGGPRVVLGPSVGEDAAVIDMPDRYLVAKIDPITFATDEIGWYAVHINANDIATTGATPLWFMATLLLPEAHATTAMARSIFEQIAAACHSLNVAVVGGHTEITYGFDRPIVVGSMLGEVAKDRLIRTGGAQPGDVIMLTKGAPLEATAILAREKREALLPFFSAEEIDHCAGFLHDPGISVVPDAQVATAVGGVTSMHDPTEGGLLTGLWELSEASGCRLEVDLRRDHPLWLPEGKAICEALGLDPAGAIASGALLLTVQADHVEQSRRAFERTGIAVHVVGRVAGQGAGVVDARRGALARPARDEIARLFE